MEHPMFKVCSMSQASVASKKKAKSAIGISLLFFFCLINVCDSIYRFSSTI